jgi:ABC-type uncharacterized transport system permease subunit
MPTLSQRIFLGYVAGSIAVLIFHQGTLGFLYLLGWSPLAPFRIIPTPPFWIPLIVSLCFWGGVYGALFGAVEPHLRVSPWIGGVLIGLLAAAIGWFLVAPLKGQPIASGFAAWPMVRSLVMNLAWGVGTSLLMPLLSPRPLWHRAPG